jgi:hypothetical protein
MIFMNTITQADTPDAIPMKGVTQAKKNPPKLIEKMIDKVEEFLTTPAEPLPKPPQDEQKITASDQQTQAQSSEEVDEVGLPKGTTITLPDGKAFETQTESTIRKVKGGE